MKIKIYITGLIATLFLFLGCKSENSRIDNIVTFAKVYGYVKYFHPGYEALQINWNQFSIYGASQIDKCNTKEDVINTLNQLFGPIAPSVKFANSSTAFNNDLKDILPENKENYKLTYWQHLGVSTDMDRKNQPYISRLIYRGDEADANQNFDYEPEFGECIIKEVGKGIFCRIPMVLYYKNQLTFPAADKNKLAEFNEILKNTNISDVEDPYLRLGNIVNVYNVFQHFYPYFDVVDVNWESELEKAIRQSYSDKTVEDHLVTLQEFTAPLHDGHISVWNNAVQNYYLPPIAWDWIENRLVITKVFDDKYEVKTGDIVTQIDNRESADYFEDVYARISAGTMGWLHYRANLESLMGKKDSKIMLTVNGRTIEMERNMAANKMYEILNKEKVTHKKLDSKTWYLNLDAVEMDTINKLLPQLEQSEAIICDLRGYPKGNHGFIKYLMSIDDTTQAWMQVPEIVYPDHERIIGFQNHNWIDFMKAEKPYLGNKNVVFIIDGQAISYAESYMGYIEGYKLATIVGQPTAGTNGNVNPFTLPGGYKIAWTGMKVVKHNGSQHHGVGILPNIYIEKTIQGVKEGRDEFLEKALEVVKKGAQ